MGVVRASVLAWACFVFVGSAGDAFAQAASALPSMHYEAAAGCPTQSVFAERLHARLLADGTRVPPEISLQVLLSPRGAGTHGSVEVQRGATKTQRTVDGGGCDEVADALALIAALALSEQDARATHHDGSEKRVRVRKVDKAAPARSPAAQQWGGRDRRDALDANGTTDRADTGASSASADSVVGSPPALDVAPSAVDSDENAVHDSAAAGSGGRDAAAAAPSGGSAAGPADEAAASSRRSTNARASREAADVASTPWRFGGSVGAAAMVFNGLAPSLQTGLQLTAALRLRSATSSWSAQLGARIAHSDRLTSPNGDARFGFVGAVVRLCGSSQLGSERLVLGWCAVAEPGVLSISGENTINRRNHSRFWLAAGAGADLSISVASWLNIRGGAELLAPFRRDRVLLAGDTLYRVPALGVRVHLGLEVPFG